MDLQDSFQKINLKKISDLVDRDLDYDIVFVYDTINGEGIYLFKYGLYNPASLVSETELYSYMFTIIKNKNLNGVLVIKKEPEVLVDIIEGGGLKYFAFPNCTNELSKKEKTITILFFDGESG
jgi:hypothetical protein